MQYASQIPDFQDIEDEGVGGTPTLSFFCPGWRQTPLCRFLCSAGTPAGRHRSVCRDSGILRRIGRPDPPRLESERRRGHPPQYHMRPQIGNTVGAGSTPLMRGNAGRKAGMGCWITSAVTNLPLGTPSFSFLCNCPKALAVNRETGYSLAAHEFWRIRYDDVAGMY